MQNYVILYFLSRDLEKQLRKHQNYYKDKLTKFKTLQDNSLSNDKAKG